MQRKGEVEMPVKKKSSATTKLIGCAIVIAVVVCAAKNEMLVKDQQTSSQIQRSRPPMVAVPVDRHELSQRLLPALHGAYSIAAENQSGSTSAKTIETIAQTNHHVSTTGPSAYERKLADQKAWGSQPRRASIASTAKRPVQSTINIGVSIAQNPIVPGHEDPHLQFESPFLELAVGPDGQPANQLTAKDTIEFKELPELSSDDSPLASLAVQPLPANQTPADAASVVTVPSTAPSASPARVPNAPGPRVARTWETGRY